VCNSIDGIRTVHGLAQRRFRVIELLMTMTMTMTMVMTMTMTMTMTMMTMMMMMTTMTTRDALVPIERQFN